MNMELTTSSSSSSSSAAVELPPLVSASGAHEQQLQQPNVPTTTTTTTTGGHVSQFTPEQEEEMKLRSKYPNPQKQGGSNFVQKLLHKGVSKFGRCKDYTHLTL
jgi:hypothetical protein